MDWQSHPTDDAIEAVIQQATATAPYSRSAPLRDTRTQLFVGNVILVFLIQISRSLMFSLASL